MDLGKVQKRGQSRSAGRVEKESGDPKFQSQRERRGTEGVDDEGSDGGGLGDVVEGIADVGEVQPQEVEVNGGEAVVWRGIEGSLD